jgi:hypothetical protein
MNADDLILISVDDHIIEPPGLNLGRICGVSATSRFRTLR